MKRLKDANWVETSLILLLLFLVVMLWVTIFNLQECTAYKFPDGATTDSGKVGWVNDGITYVRDVEEFCIQTDYKFR